MPKLLIGTGIDGFDGIIRDRYAGLFEAIIIPFAMGFEMMTGQPGDVAVISQMLGTENSIALSANDTFVRIVNHLRKQGVRVCFFGSQTDQDKAFIRELVSRGVYDILVSDELAYEDVFRLVEEPSSYGAVAHWVEGESSLQQIRRRKIQLVLNETKPKQETQEISEPEPQQRTLFRFSARKTSREPVQERREPKTIFVSSLPGTGASFVALNLAVALSFRHQTVVVEAAERPALVPWLRGTQGEDGLLHLMKGESVQRRWMITEQLRVFAVDPNVDKSPTINTKALLQSVRRLEADYVVLELPFEDFIQQHQSDYSILVANGDLVKCEMLAGVESSLVVLNMTPKRLPVGEEEFQAFWPAARLATYPYTDEQALSVVLGKPLALRSKNERLRFEGFVES